VDDVPAPFAGRTLLAADPTDQPLFLVRMYCQNSVNSGFSHSGGRIPPIEAGPGSLDVLAEPAGVFGNRRAVLVGDEAVVATGYVDRLRTVLNHVDEIRLHVVPPREPTATSVDEAAAVIRHAGAAVVVGVGGGSALDTAKLASAAASGTDGVEWYALGANPLPAGRPVVAIPTTAGTGAEVTRTCVLTDGAGRKVWTWGDELLPARVVLDPDAVVTMPADVAAASGLDAFVHAIEAATGQRGRADAVVAAPALHAIRLILAHLPAATGGDSDARHRMQSAALLAGLAIDGGGTGIAHCIGHALGTLAGVPHGIAVAVGLSAALRWNVDGAPEAYASVAATVGRSVDGLADAYAELVDAAGLPFAVRRVGELPVSAPDLAAAMVAEENLPMYRNNCRIADARERKELATWTLRTWAELRAAA
jgi:alcohol dehydrogenase class IV